MNRRLLAAVALVVVLSLSGCSTIFGDDVNDPEALSQDADYEFDTERDAYVRVNADNYTAVYNVSATREDGNAIELYTTDALSLEQPLELYGLQFQYPNGTRLRYAEDGSVQRIFPNGTTEPAGDGVFAVSNDRSRTTVQLPAEEGQLAFTTPKSGKEVAVQTPVEGSYELVLPPNTDASLPILSQVRPSNDERFEDGNRVHLVWEKLDAELLVVRWYLDRDIWLFGGVAVLGIAVGLVGAGYYYLQIRQARRRREEEGIDVDYDDDRDGPPPGMR